MDRLVSESIAFSNDFVQNPVCLPSRASLMTGRYPRHHGVRWNSDDLGRYEMTMAGASKKTGSGY
jgi:arylsulfatase A-like enzyme